MKTIALIFLVVSASASASLLNNDEGNPGCHMARTVYLLAGMHVEIMEEDPSFLKQARNIKSRACAGEFREGQTISYPNGQTATLFAGKEGATWYWPNGSVLTLYGAKRDATWMWPNGQVLTLYAYKRDVTWHWPNGQLMTLSAGKRGAYYFAPDGSTYSHSGPELLDSRGDVDVEALLDYVEGSLL